VRPTRGFSLIELLVVISIVALLVGILLPVLGSARDSARSAQCLSNLRQMGIALQGYATTEHDYLPLYYRIEPGGWLNYWFGRGQGSSVPEGSRQLQPERGAIGPYLGRGVVEGLLCPSFPYDNADFHRKFATRACSYGINLALAPYPFQTTNPGVPVRLNDIEQPADVMSFADGVQYWSVEDGFNEAFYIGIDNPSAADPLADPNGGFAHFRHAGATQLAYLDGHAAADKFPDIPRTHDDLGGSPAGHLTTGDIGPDTIYGKTW